MSEYRWIDAPRAVIEIEPTGKGASVVSGWVEAVFYDGRVSVTAVEGPNGGQAYSGQGSELGGLYVGDVRCTGHSLYAVVDGIITGQTPGYRYVWHRGFLVECTNTQNEKLHTAVTMRLSAWMLNHPEILALGAVAERNNRAVRCEEEYRKAQEASSAALGELERARESLEVATFLLDALDVRFAGYDPASRAIAQACFPVQP